MIQGDAGGPPMPMLWISYAKGSDNLHDSATVTA